MELNDEVYQLAPLARMFAGLPHSVDGLRDDRIIFISMAGPGPRKGTIHGTPDFLSFDTDRGALHLLQRSRPKIGEPERYHKDVPNAKVHVLDAGHFALDTRADEIAALVREFMTMR
jgi:pimeloyl-ACP methyl ester carboxylesterase